ncbi:MAG: PTS sugar transporter subunit IIA [Planctomycetota bacterium]|nr:MAG: PTS sugar transporter subunit IIA [Planctomycetota bacterium]
MKLGDLLKEGQIAMGFQARDKWEAIDKMVDLLVAHNAIKADQRAAVTSALVAREKVASTGMEHGVAIPHASIDEIDNAVAALAIAPEGIPFQSADGRPARIVILLVIPRKTVQKHIRTLAGIARLIQYEEMRDALTNARSAREALGVIREEEKKDPA